MKRLYVCFLVFYALCMNANPVSQEAARTFAQEFVNSKGLSLVAQEAPVFSKRRAKNKSEAAYYVFDIDGDNGFVIVSGDDRTEAILGFTEKGYFDERAIPDNMKTWLQDCAYQIENIDRYKVVNAAPKGSYPAIEPLLRTNWNQYSPFYGLCPYVDGSRCVTGCVATAMAQIMYYHQWPQDATEPIAGYTTSTLGLTLDALPATTFRWEEMPLSAYVDENLAVAELLRYCGQSIGMDYTLYASSAYTFNIAKALTTYFDYDQDVRVCGRGNYTCKEWTDLIYKELSEKRPVAYSGTGVKGFREAGHCFVCDGYDSDGLFHINWGWGGGWDGYFRLAILDPDGSDISTQGYAFFQEAVIGIQPPKVEKDEIYLSADNLDFHDKAISCSFINNNKYSAAFDYGWAVKGTNGEISEILTQNSAEFGSNEIYFFELDLSKKELGKGTCKIVPVSKESTTEVWKQSTKSSIYISVSVEENGDISMTKHPLVDLDVVGCEMKGNKTATCRQQVVFTVKNNADDYVDMMYLCASKADDLNFVPNSENSISIANGEIAEDKTVQVGFVFTPAEAGKYNLWLVDGNRVFGQAVVEVEPFPVQNVELALENFAVAPAASSVKVDFSVVNKSDIAYDKPLKLYLLTEIDDLPGWYTYLSETSLANTIEPGETSKYSHVFNDLEAGKNYVVRVTYFKFELSGDEVVEVEDYLVSWHEFTTETATAIKSATDNVPVNGDLYNLNGQKSLFPIKNGIYICNGKKILKQ